MCTCIAYQNESRLFGRSLDLERSFQERILITPRRYAMHFCHLPAFEQHYGMLGMASGNLDYPLYAEAINEKGLVMAGLYFPGNTCYGTVEEGKSNIASYEVIPWILSQCKNVDDVIRLLPGMHITNDCVSEDLTPVPLHWMVSDMKKSLVLEPGEFKVEAYENPFEVLTNSPPFPYYTARMSEMLNLTSEYPGNRFSQDIRLKPYGEGFGALGLPGDMSPGSRFIRAAFLNCHSKAEKDRFADLSQMFHILEQVSILRGAVITDEGLHEMTRYVCCIDMNRKIYYYRTYNSLRVFAVALEKTDLDSVQLQEYKLGADSDILFHN